MRAAFTLGGNAKTCAPTTSYSSSSFLSSASSLIRRRNERSEERRVVIRASSSDENPTRNSTSSSTSKVSEDDESFTLADVGEDSTLAEKRNEFQEAIAKAQTEQKEKKIFDEKSESSTWEVKGTEVSSLPPPPAVAKPLTDLSRINVDATAIEKEKKRNDDDGDKDEPLRMIGSAPVKSSSGEPTFSKQLSRTVKRWFPKARPRRRY